MTEINDEYMREMISKTKHYCAAILRHESNWNNWDKTQKEKIIWEHGRRNFVLRRDGILPIVCPIVDESDVSGVGIFNASLAEVRKIMDEDPGVKEGLFVYEVHNCRSFPEALS